MPVVILGVQFPFGLADTNLFWTFAPPQASSRLLSVDFVAIMPSIPFRTGGPEMTRVSRHLSLAKIACGYKAELMYEFSVRICGDFRQERA